MQRIGVHLNALRAFEAAGRLSSISRAAEELNVSHSTVSHHVKGLELALGVALFERRDRSVVLTDDGANLLPALSESFDAIAAALETIKPLNHSKSLRVTVTPSFANRWLVPMLRRFRTEFSDINVQLTPSLALLDFRKEKIDIGIRCGDGNWPDVDSELLMPIHMTPLCSPGLLDEQGSVNSPQDLHHLTLLHADIIDSSEIKSEWSTWLRAAGAAPVERSDGLSLHDPGLVLQAAVDGLGVAMGYVELAQRDLANGRLVAPFDLTITHPWSYYVVTPKRTTISDQVNVFRNWIKQEATLSLPEEQT